MKLKALYQDDRLMYSICESDRAQRLGLDLTCGGDVMTRGRPGQPVPARSRLRAASSSSVGTS